MDVALGKRIIALRERVTAHFNGGHWTELGLLTGTSDIINGTYRLFRSLDWADEDYPERALDALTGIVQRNPGNFKAVEDFLNEKFPNEGEYVSAKPSVRKITFAPNVFQVPEGATELDLVAVMMPFSGDFMPTFEAIKNACKVSGHRCVRVDNIWEDSVLVQDVFNLIFRAHIVVVDFSAKNANVMYETGIAHTLGKHVVPITQSADDVPFDLRHLRFVKYLPNNEGRAVLTSALAERLKYLGGGVQEQPHHSGKGVFGDDIPF